MTEGCSVFPSYGADPDKSATHCAKHGKKLGMTDVKSPKCVIQGCSTWPSYGADPDKRPTHCSTHGKQLGMVDAKRLKCAVQGCSIRPYYGADPDKRATHCGNHGKELGMTDVKSLKCATQGCSTGPSYGIDPDKSATHCAFHGKKLGMTDVKSPKCVIEGCPVRAHPTWKGHCAACYADCNPGDPLVTARYKTEVKIKLFLNETLDAGISSLSTFNMMNVRSSRAQSWMQRYEFDFVLLGGRGVIKCDGIQHKRDVSYFKTTAAAQISNDVKKTSLLLDHDVFEVSIDQDDTWKDRFNWMNLLTGMLDFCVNKKTKGISSCVVGLRNESDMTYRPYIDAMLLGPHADKVYEAFLTPNEQFMLTVIRRITGERTNWRIPSDFTLSRWPEEAASAVSTQQTIAAAFKRRRVVNA